MSIFWRLVATTALIALAVAVGWVTLIDPIFNPSGIHDAASLPDRIQVCGRTWTKNSSEQLSRADVQLKFGVEPLLVSPNLLAPCPPGPCSRDGNNWPCNTVVFVRVGEDLFMDYALAGGP